MPSASSKYATEALELLGQLIRQARLRHSMTVSELAALLGVAQEVVEGLERGDHRTEVGVAFEAAARLGIRLFDADEPTLEMRLVALRKIVALLPPASRSIVAFDDF
jgi:transcriptional regulator with XRE-family HTH domain